MKALLIFLVLAVGAMCNTRILKVETNQVVKSKAKWESYDIHENPFRDYSEDDVKILLGTTLLWDQSNIMLLQDLDDHNVELPESYDVRQALPGCVSEVRNQEHCGSCWAFSAASTLADRFCVASKGQDKVILSHQDMVSCDSKDKGCHGGLLDRAWDYLEKSGIVAEECFPYVSGDGKNVPHCPHGTCINASSPFTKYRAVLASPKPLTCAPQIKKEIFENGPVQTGFMVHEDFMHYKSGIYEHTHGDQLGGHAVKIVGWGVENGIEYWIAQNSWGPTWGENGFFRIKFGECLFDANGYAGLPNLKDFTSNHFLW
jgi:cathepsin B